MENYRPKRPSRPIGGQHAATIGDSTLHHACPWDFSLELQRAGERFDIDSCGDCEPQTSPAEFEAFELERKRLAGQPDVGF